MYTDIHNYLDLLQGDLDNLNAARKEKLDTLSQMISDERDQKSIVDLVFVCTHNSRRSHLAQIWAAACINYLGLKGIRTYSAGTKATALNENVIRTLREKGFQVSTPDVGNNPQYHISYSEDADPVVCFSKKLDDASLPTGSFVAVMTCSEAEDHCPIIPEASHRVPITYDDPKSSDGTGEERRVYGERSRQIATEMLYLISKVRSKS